MPELIFIYLAEIPSTEIVHLLLSNEKFKTCTCASIYNGRDVRKIRVKY